MDEYDGRQFVGIDLHRRASWGESPEVVLEATYGWYWAADVLADAGATVHLAHPLGVKGFAYRRVLCRIRHRTRYADRRVMPTRPGGAACSRCGPSWGPAG